MDKPNKKKEVIIIGDFNVHNRSILCNENEKSTYEKSLNRISNIYKNYLINNGMKILSNQKYI